MTLEEIIITNSNATISKLWGPSNKALKEPTNGITVNIPAAAAVIRDCAMITVKYLPHYVFGLYGNPYQELKGKITLDQIKDFAERAKIDFTTYQLLELIIKRAATGVDTLPIPESSDPYGDYEVVKVQEEHNDIHTLAKLFGVI
jgi:hypothetical protein